MAQNSPAKSLAPVWSGFGLITILVVVTLVAGVNYLNIIQEIFQFATGTLPDPNGTDNVLTIWTTGVAIAVIGLILSIASMQIVQRVAGDNSSFVDLDAFVSIGPATVFSVMVIEETFRWLFVRVGYGLFAPNTMAFYILALTANTIWALVHLTNFTDPKDRHPIRVLPQFIAGILFTYVMVKYSFWWAVFVHISGNCILFSMMKKQDVRPSTLINTIYYSLAGLAGLIALLARGNNLQALTPWLEGNYQPLAGFTTLDYILVDLIVTSSFIAVANILLLDSEKESTKGLNPIRGCLMAIMMVALVLGLNWGLGFVIGEPFHRVTIMAAMFMCMTETKSGSELTRRWFITLPVMFVFIVATSTLGFWIGLWILVASYAYNYLPSLIRLAEDEIIKAIEKKIAEEAQVEAARKAALALRRYRTYRGYRRNY